MGLEVSKSAVHAYLSNSQNVDLVESNGQIQLKRLDAHEIDESHEVKNIQIIANFVALHPEIIKELKPLDKLVLSHQLQGTASDPKSSMITNIFRRSIDLASVDKLIFKSMTPGDLHHLASLNDFQIKSKDVSFFKHAIISILDSQTLSKEELVQLVDLLAILKNSKGDSMTDSHILQLISQQISRINERINFSARGYIHLFKEATGNQSYSLLTKLAQEVVGIDPNEEGLLKQIGTLYSFRDHLLPSSTPKSILQALSHEMGVKTKTITLAYSLIELNDPKVTLLLGQLFPEELTKINELTHSSILLDLVSKTKEPSLISQLLQIPEIRQNLNGQDQKLYNACLKNDENGKELMLILGNNGFQNVDQVELKTKSSLKIETVDQLMDMVPKGNLTSVEIQTLVDATIAFVRSGELELQSTDGVNLFHNLAAESVNPNYFLALAERGFEGVDTQILLQQTIQFNEELNLNPIEILFLNGTLKLGMMNEFTRLMGSEGVGQNMSELAPSVFAQLLVNKSTSNELYEAALHYNPDIGSINVEGQNLFHLIASIPDFDLRLISGFNQDDLKEIVQSKDSNGLTPLDKAFSQKNLNFLLFLMEKGVSISIETISDKLASVIEPTKLYQFLKQAGFNVEEVFSIIQTTFSIQDREKHFLAAINAGFDFYTPSDQFYLPIHDMVKDQDKHDLLKFLINKGIDVNLPDKDGFPPLYYAIQEKVLNMIELLGNNGAFEQLSSDMKVKVRDLLIEEFSEGKIDKHALESIIKFDPSLLSAKDREGKTFFHRAVQLGDIDTIKLFISMDASPFMKDSNGETVLLTALRNEPELFIQILDVALKMDRESSLQIVKEAIKFSSSDKIKPILSSVGELGTKDLVTIFGGQPSFDKLCVIIPILHSISGLFDKIPVSWFEAVDRNGNSLTERAAITGNENLFKALMTRGAPLTGRNEMGYNVLDFACLSGNIEIVKLCLEKGKFSEEDVSKALLNFKPSDAFKMIELKNLVPEKILASKVKEALFFMFGEIDELARMQLIKEDNPIYRAFQDALPKVASSEGAKFLDHVAALQKIVAPKGGTFDYAMNFFEVDPGHYKIEFKTLEFPKAVETNHNLILDLFDQHVPKDYIAFDDGHIPVSYDELRLGLQFLFNERIKNEMAATGVPSKDPEKGEFYAALKNKYCVLIDELRKQNDPDKYVQVLVDIAIGARHCGERWDKEATDHYGILSQILESLEVKDMVVKLESDLRVGQFYEVVAEKGVKYFDKAAPLMEPHVEATALYFIQNDRGIKANRTGHLDQLAPKGLTQEETLVAFDEKYNQGSMFRHLYENLNSPTLSIEERDSYERWLSENYPLSSKMSAVIGEQIDSIPNVVANVRSQKFDLGILPKEFRQNIAIKLDPDGTQAIAKLKDDPSEFSLWFSKQVREALKLNPRDSKFAEFKNDLVDAVAGDEKLQRKMVDFVNNGGGDLAKLFEEITVTHKEITMTLDMLKKLGYSFNEEVIAGWIKDGKSPEKLKELLTDLVSQNRRQAVLKEIYERDHEGNQKGFDCYGQEIPSSQIVGAEFSIIPHFKPQAALLLLAKASCSRPKG